MVPAYDNSISWYDTIQVEIIPQRKRCFHTVCRDDTIKVEMMPHRLRWCYTGRRVDTIQVVELIPYRWIWYHTDWDDAIQVELIPYRWIWYHTDWDDAIQVEMIPCRSSSWYHKCGFDTIQAGMIPYRSKRWPFHALLHKNVMEKQKDGWSEERGYGDTQDVNIFRKDSALKDGFNEGVDLSGGYYDGKLYRYSEASSLAPTPNFLGYLLHL